MPDMERGTSGSLLPQRILHWPMARGIIETVGLAGTVLFAAPVALFGADLLANGSALRGAAFLAIAVLMIAVPRYVRTPGDVPGAVAERAVSGAVKTEDEE